MVLEFLIRTKYKILVILLLLVLLITFLKRIEGNLHLINFPPNSDVIASKKVVKFSGCLTLQEPAFAPAENNNKRMRNSSEINTSLALRLMEMYIGRFE